MSDAVRLVAGQQTDARFGDAPPYELSALVQASAGSIVIYDGTDATGAPVLASAGIGVVGLNDNVYCRKGVFVVITGGAVGSVLTS